jgi:hypothetical protein
MVLTGGDAQRAAAEVRNLLALLVQKYTYWRRRRCQTAILEQAVNAAGSSATEVLRVSLRVEADKAKVTGHQSQIRGGLFKVIDDMNNVCGRMLTYADVCWRMLTCADVCVFKAIDDFNNPNSADASADGLLVIVCYVNETGQVLLNLYATNWTSMLTKPLCY